MVVKGEGVGEMGIKKCIKEFNYEETQFKRLNEIKGHFTK